MKYEYQLGTEKCNSIPDLDIETITFRMPFSEALALPRGTFVKEDMTLFGAICEMVVHDEDLKKITQHWGGINVVAQLWYTADYRDELIVKVSDGL